MFGIGETELVIIVVFAFLLFGPDKLPGMGRTLGRVLRQFREASDGFTEVVQTNIMDPASEELEKSPKQRKREEAGQLAATDAAEESQPSETAAPQPKRETFAERKARLLAERKAAEAAKSTQTESSQDEPAAPEVAGPVAPTPEPTAEATGPAVDAAKPARTSAADLYALTSQKSSRALAKEAAKAQRAPEVSDASDAAMSGEEDGKE